MEITQHWRLNAQRYALQGTVCAHCGTAHFPPRAVCTACANGHAHDEQATEAAYAQPVVASPARQASPNGRAVPRLAPNPA